MAKKSRRTSKEPQRNDPAITPADALDAALREQYPELVSDDLARLAACWSIIQTETARAEGRQEAQPSSQAECERLYRMSHDFKGHAGSYGYPLASVIAESICQLLKEGALATSAGRIALDRRIKGLQFVIKERVSGDADETTKNIVAALYMN